MWPVQRQNLSMRLGWLTDLHLNFVHSLKRSAFYAHLREEKLDAVLLGGDIGEADSVTELLAEMANGLRIPIYFVLGNHDFYGGSIGAVREAVAREAAVSPWLHWLPASGVDPPDRQCHVGRPRFLGRRSPRRLLRSEVALNDYFLITELRSLQKQERYAKLNALGAEAAEFLEYRVLEALPRCQNVIVLTHVPPFRESCRHEGQISTGDFLPHFACRAVGERLASIMRAHPDRNMVVLCGHTHSPGFARILDNLVVLTGGAQYGVPALQQVLEPESLSLRFL